jgi:hypothetical protein
MVPDQVFFPRRTEEVVMNVPAEYAHALRVWIGAPPRVEP